MRQKKFISTGIGATLLAVILFSGQAMATPEFAEDTAQGCLTCHLGDDGGELARTGLEFAASGYVWPPKGGYRVLGPIRRTGRFIVGYLHILAAFMWFGTILYVHILLRPAYAAKGLPRGEVFVGLVSMVIVGVTGTLLTISRIRSIDVLFSSPWGIILSVKILFYIIMVSSALFIVLFVGPKLRSGKRAAVMPPDGIFDLVTLTSFDGKEGRPAFVAVGDKVYDVSLSPLWKEGGHMNHLAGGDMTDTIGRAPHGDEKLESFPVKGSFSASHVPPKTPAQKAFYFVAYVNLTIVFIVLGVIAFWRWGI
jgi:predicted heme/steroid binding protein